MKMGIRIPVLRSTLTPLPKVAEKMVTKEKLWMILFKGLLILMMLRVRKVVLLFQIILDIELVFSFQKILSKLKLRKIWACSPAVG